jgi:hypothetical protein
MFRFFILSSLLFPLHSAFAQRQIPFQLMNPPTAPSNSFFCVDQNEKKPFVNIIEGKTYKVNALEQAYSEQEKLETLCQEQKKGDLFSDIDFCALAKQPLSKEDANNWQKLNNSIVLPTKDFLEEVSLGAQIGTGKNNRSGITFQTKGKVCVPFFSDMGITFLPYDLDLFLDLSAQGPSLSSRQSSIHLLDFVGALSFFGIDHFKLGGFEAVSTSLTSDFRAYNFNLAKLESIFSFDSINLYGKLYASFSIPAISAGGELGLFIRLPFSSVRFIDLNYAGNVINRSEKDTLTPNFYRQEISLSPIIVDWAMPEESAVVSAFKGDEAHYDIMPYLAPKISLLREDYAGKTNYGVNLSFGLSF